MSLPVEQRTHEVVRRLVRPLPIVAEIGVDKGSMSRELLRQHGRLYLYMIDSWAAPGAQPAAYVASGDYHARMSEAEQLARLRAAEAATEFAAARRCILRRPSVEAAAAFVDEFFDAVFVDADHTLEGVRADLAAWWPKIRPGGWLCGHDWSTPGHQFGVEQAVREFGRPFELGADQTWFITRC